MKLFPARMSVLGLLLLLATPVVQAAEIDFARQIAPLFEQTCVRCHSPGNEKGDLTLHTFHDLQENGYVVPGDADSSYLVDLITSADGKRPEMPKEGKPLEAEQVALIRTWIEQGAKWPKDLVIREKSKADASWWSLQRLAEVQPPSVENAPPKWQANPIDRFIFAKLTEKGLQPNPPADRRALIRRVTYDLTGLPPTPEEVEAFVSSSDPKAYEKLVDRLLASPHYGERWGRHWLDVVRFGESNGFERNVIINNLWPFRDYVIRSFNQDKPFDQFIREHLAGDVFGKDQPEVEVGSAFLVAGPYDNVGNQDPVQAAQIRANTIDEMIRSTSEAFLGLTIGCARCHDHKFDPIRQRDYYSLYATFAGVRHGDRVVATAEQKQQRTAKVRPLEQQRTELTKQQQMIEQSILQRGRDRLAEYNKRWQRPPTSRLGTEETFPPLKARYVKLVSEGQDSAPANRSSFRIDEFEIWSAEDEPRNVALTAHGGKASGPSRQIEDFPGAYGPHLAIDGKFGARFIATGGYLQIELAEPTVIERVFFSSARGESTPEHRKFVFLADYRIEASMDGKNWTVIADSQDRKPVDNRHRDHRLRQLETTQADRKQLADLNRKLSEINRQLTAIPPLPKIWVGNRVSAKGPFHIFLGGSPQRHGEEVIPSSLSALTTPAYELDPSASESERRLALANWIVHPKNPLTPRVLVNRLWHYHFGTGIVDTPSDFGYMGSKPTHPQLLDWLANELHTHDWHLKPLHKLIVLSQTYQQSSAYRAEAAQVDGDARLLWRFPPRRLSAEEIRDTVLFVAGKLDTRRGGPGFRLYRYLQDNVSTYVPLAEHGPDTYRRAVYHQNARASAVDLLTDFDQPDCAFATPRRASTTTPLQALTMLNHDFTLDMASFLAERLEREAENQEEQLQRAFALCYGRSPTAEEQSTCAEFVEEHSLQALCRVLLNTSELIYIQ